MSPGKKNRRGNQKKSRPGGGAGNGGGRRDERPGQRPGQRPAPRPNMGGGAPAAGNSSSRVSPRVGAPAGAASGPSKGGPSAFLARAKSGGVARTDGRHEGRPVGQNEGGAKPHEARPVESRGGAGGGSKKSRDQRGGGGNFKSGGRDQRGGREQRGGRPNGGGGRSGGGGRGGRSGGGKDGSGNAGKFKDAAASLKATVDRNRKGFCFLIFDNRAYEDTFVSARDGRSLFHGDRVSVRLRSDGSIASLDVLQRRFEEFYGRFRKFQSSGFVSLNRKKIEEDIPIEKIPTAFADLKTGQWVRAKLISHDRGAVAFSCEILEVLSGPDGLLPAHLDLPMIASEYGLVEAHAEDAVAQAKTLKFDEDLRNGRRDLRNIPFITIDGETARDFDDAVYVERKGSGFRLWVAIADVSHYVTENSALDREALSRGTSVYFPERAFHMLPRELSEGLCSLRPDGPRLSMGCTIDFDRDGHPGEIEVFDCLIHSRRRATYTEIYAESLAHGRDPKWEYAAHLELYRQLRKTRLARGSIDFDLPEAEIVVSPDGQVQTIKLRERNDAHMLIEEFMIAANEGVTRWALARKLPFLYRVHELPSAEAIQRFFALCNSFGIKTPKEALAELKPKNFSKLLQDIAASPASELLNLSFLRSLKQAGYTHRHGSHFGLASEAYTHFTSPIRRYPDLVVHRMLKRALRGSVSAAEKATIEQRLEEITLHCNFRERLASEAERESIRLKQVRVMRDHLGESFDGSVTGMSISGMFVRLDEVYCEGRVSFESIGYDAFEFLEDKMIVRGRRSKEVFKIGTPVRIRVANADLERRMIDFELERPAKPT